MKNKLQMQENIINTYSKKMIIDKVAENLNERTATVRSIYEAIEDNVASILSSATPDIDITVKLFEGISINGKYIPEHKKLNNLTGAVITTKKKIKPKVNITKEYCEKLTANSQYCSVEN